VSPSFRISNEPLDSQSFFAISFFLEGETFLSADQFMVRALAAYYFVLSFLLPV